MMLQITMGQAFRGALEAAINEAGGAFVSSGYSDASTLWTVVARFAKGTARRDVVQFLWARFPSAAVMVQQASVVRYTAERDRTGFWGLRYFVGGVAYPSLDALRAAYPGVELKRIKATRRNRLFG